LESYSKQKKIGQGASGSVYVARVKESASSSIAREIYRTHGPKGQVAIKQMDLRNQPRKELIVNEIIVMKESKHPNIVNFLDSFLQEQNNELWVVMEFMEGGALTDVIDNNPVITEDQISTICFETCKGLAHLHSQDIIHRDIKSDNVLLDRVGNVKISKSTCVNVPNFANHNVQPILVSVPSSPNPRANVLPWSAHLTGWLQKL
jgi:serine/threonine protein kinase